MRLVDLNPCWVGEGGEYVTSNGQPVPRREGVGVSLECPCGCPSELYVPFAIALDGSPTARGEQGWQRTGDTFETLTLSPSILRRGPDSCGWHGYIENGAVRTV